MIKRQKLLIASLGLAVLAILAVVILLGFSARPQLAGNLAKTNQPAKSAQKPPQAPKFSNSAKSIFAKPACDLFDGQLAAKTLGNGAVKNDQLTTFTTGEYNSTACEYSAGAKKATVMIYEYPDVGKATANKTSVQTSQLVSENGGKTTSLKPKQSAAEVKDKYVVTATVSVADKFDNAASQQLLKEIIGKL